MTAPTLPSSLLTVNPVGDRVVVVEVFVVELVVEDLVEAIEPVDGVVVAIRDGIVVRSKPGPASRAPSVTLGGNALRGGPPPVGFGSAVDPSRGDAGPGHGGSSAE